MLIESAIHFFESHGEAAEVVRKFWRWLLDILMELEGVPFSKLRIAMIAVLKILKTHAWALEELQKLVPEQRRESDVTSRGLVS